MSPSRCRGRSKDRVASRVSSTRSRAEGASSRAPATARHTGPVSTADESRPVRDEDAFDVAAVADWLRKHADESGVVPEGTPEVRQFPGGASNLTFLLRWSRPGSTDESRELILRRPPVGA